MSIYSVISDFVRIHHARRRHVRAAMRIAELPRGMQKDIGWPDRDFGEDFRTRAVSATERPQ
jgi:hypothetical protein